MRRRDFLAATSLAAAIPTGTAMTTNQATGKQYFELRRYHLLTGKKKDRVGDFFRDCAIPALNRLGVGPVGAFTVIHGPNQPTLYVLLPHPSLESVATLSERLLADKQFGADGADFLGAGLDDPAYGRLESSLMEAFDGMPKLEVPPQLSQEKPRIFELRIYESHSLRAGKKKVQMFNAGGEIAIFRKTGLRPVFFGETIIGPRMPNLTYMLVFDDMAARDAAWQAFIGDPDWARLRGDEQYADTVSNITDIILRPASFSQV